MSSTFEDLRADVEHCLTYTDDPAEVAVICRETILRYWGELSVLHGLIGNVIKPEFWRYMTTDTHAPDDPECREFLSFVGRWAMRLID